MTKDRTPPEVKAARRRKARRRLLISSGFLALWWVLFLTGLATDMGWFLWAGWIAITGELITLYGLHEKALRRIANRPAPDYALIHKLEKTNRKQVKAVAESKGPET